METLTGRGVSRVNDDVPRLSKLHEDARRCSKDFQQVWYELEMFKVCRDYTTCRRGKKEHQYDKYFDFQTLEFYTRIMDDDDDKVTKTSFCQLFRYALPFDYFLLTVGCSAAFIGGGSQAFLMIAFSSALDLVSTPASTTSMAELLGPAINMLLIVTGVVAFCFFVSYSAVPYSASRMVQRMRQKLFQSVLRQDLSWYDQRTPGEISLLINENCEDIERGMSKKMLEMFQSVSQFIFGMGTAFYFSWQLTLLLLGFVPLMGLAAAALFKMVGGDMMKLREKSYKKAGAVASEAIQSIRTIMSFSGEYPIATKYESYLDEAKRGAIGLTTKVGSSGAFMMSIMFLMYGSGFWYGGTLIASSRVDAIALHPPPAGYVNQNWTDYQAAATNPWFGLGASASEFCKKYHENPMAMAVCACDIPWPDEMDGVVLSKPNCGCGWRAGDSVAEQAVDACAGTGSILTAFFCLITGAFSLGQFSPAAEAVGNARVKAAKVFALIDRVPDIDVDAVAGQKLVTHNGNGSGGRCGISIEFKNISFAYKKTVLVEELDHGDEEKEKKQEKEEKEEEKEEKEEKEQEEEKKKTKEIEIRPVFKQLSFTIQPGETVAFVGESGR